MPFARRRGAQPKNRNGVTHGMKYTRTYSSWNAMKMRCLWPNAPAYPKYGGRGITVCDRWMFFENFLADMGERPEGTTLDRIDGTKGYEPGNCRWATHRQQSDNKRNAKLSPELALMLRRDKESGLSTGDLASKYGVSRGMVWLVVTERAWPSQE